MPYRLLEQGEEIQEGDQPLDDDCESWNELVGWNTNTADFALAVSEFERALPGFWWSVGQCSVGAHASCAVDGSGVQAELLEDIPKGHVYDEGFHVDTAGGSPADALRAVMHEAMEARTHQGEVRWMTQSLSPS
ncbi:MAG: hypothetical protein AAFZ46_12260 [Pseudomonadota bacterium]